MTCIVGIRRGSRTWIGADSGISYGDEVVSDARSKLRRCAGVVLGAAGDAAECDAALCCTLAPWLDGELSAWARDVLWPAVCASLYSRSEAKRPRELELVVGGRGALVKVASGGAVVEDIAHDYCAIGTGESVALGVLHVTAHTRRAPPWRVRRALVAAADHVTSVRGPFEVRSA